MIYPTTKKITIFVFFAGFVLGDVILQQFDSFLSVECRSEEFLSFPPMQKRLDVFLSSFLYNYPERFAFCQKLLILSHGQATVERGFSVNKEIEICNMQEDTLVAQRLVCDCHSTRGCYQSSPDKRTLEFSSISQNQVPSLP